MQAHIEQLLGAERSQMQELRASLERRERDTERLRLENEQAKQRWEGETRTLQAAKDAESSAAQERLNGLEQQLWDARSWVEYLKDMSDVKLEGNRQLEDQETQLTKIKQALGDLLDMNHAGTHGAIKPRAPMRCDGKHRLLPVGAGVAPGTPPVAAPRVT